MNRLKARLNEYKWIQENINNLENRLLEIDTKLQKITNTLQTDVVQVSKDNDKWTLLIQKKIDIENKINRVLKGYKEMESIEQLISRLDERGKLLMRYRYIDCLKWEEIAYKMHYTWQHMHRVHYQCLKDVIECDSKKVL